MMKLKKTTITDPLGAMTVHSSAGAQTAADIEQMARDQSRPWCVRMQEYIMRKYRAIESMAASRERGIALLRHPEHRVDASRNLSDWYYKKMAALFEEKRAIDIECRRRQIRRDPLPPDRPAPLPRPADPAQPRWPAPSNPGPWRYEPYERYPEPRDPFSPGWGQ